MELSSVIFTFIYLFFYHQFITQCVEVDHGSYFHNYVHRKQTQRKFFKEIETEKRKGKESRYKN